MTRRPGRSASNDPGLVALLDAKADAICFVAKSWDYHVRVALETTEEENLASIRDSVRAAKAKGREVLLDCEHFFDGYKAKPAYALACAKAAYEEGARWVVLCDTNGGTLPHEVERIVGEVCAQIPGDHVGIHAHNDTEQAVANSFAAVRAGARQIQGTLNGLGERCGNANLVSIIPTLKLKKRIRRQIRDRRVGRSARRISRASRTRSTNCSTAPPTVTRPMSARAHSPPRPASTPPRSSRSRRPTSMSRRNASAISASSWSPISPAAPTCSPNSNVSGLPSTRTIRASSACSTRSRSARRSATPTRRPTPRSSCLARRLLGKVPHYFDVEKFDVNVEQRINAKGERVTVSQAVVKVKVGDEELISVAEGIGPVNALDLALRKDLGKYQSFITGLELTDYRVRILNGGTGAVTRVLIESADETGDRWTTVGVSPNIIDASFQALMDSIVYKLVKSGAPA